MDRSRTCSNIYVDRRVSDNHSDMAMSCIEQMFLVDVVAFSSLGVDSLVPSIKNLKSTEKLLREFHSPCGNIARKIHLASNCFSFGV